MKRIILTLLFVVTIINAFGQQMPNVDTALKFNQRFTKCERKWVVISKADTAKNYLYGFIYIDSQAGFTFDMKGTFVINSNGQYIGDTTLSKNRSIKYRIAQNWRNVALLPPSRFKELHIKPQPAWIKYYYNYTDTIQHNYRWGFIYNDAGQSDTALTYLLQAYKLKSHYPGLEFELIFAYNALAQYDDAIKVLESAVQNDPKNTLFYRELGYAYLKKALYDKSIAYFKQGLDICTDKQNDTKAEIAINMAQDYKLLGNDAEYKEWGQKAKAWASAGSQLYKFIEAKGF